MSAVTKAFDSDFEVMASLQRRGQIDGDALPVLPTNEKDNSRENNVDKIKVVDWKRPLNKKEVSRKEEDIVTVDDNALTFHEPKLKVDLTAYVEKHEFCFDAILDEQVTNDEKYVLLQSSVWQTGTFNEGARQRCNWYYSSPT